MLERIKIKNFKSFLNETVIDFRKTNYSFLPQNCSKDGILKGAMFVGANASGKSNVIEAIKLLLDMLFLDKKVNSSLYKCIFSNESKYYLDYYFRITNSIVRYEIVVETHKSIISERLFVDGEIMVDRLDTNARVYIDDMKGVLYSDDDVDEDTLFIRTLYFNTKFRKSQVLREWMEYLSHSIYLNTFDRVLISYGKEDYDIFSFLNNNGSEKINSFFRDYNFKESIEYAHESHGNKVIMVLSGDKEEKNIFFKRNDINEPIPFNLESTGNQNLLRILPSFLSVVESEGMILIDEFSSGFHNELERLLVKYFMENSKRSQMIFVSHSTNLMSNSILRPDQEYVVEFNGKKGSSVKRVSSEQPRFAQNIEKMYLSGVFGGLPGYERGADEN